MSKFMLSDALRLITYVGDLKDLPDEFLKRIIHHSNMPHYAIESKDQFTIMLSNVQCGLFIREVDPRLFPGIAVTKVWAAIGHGEHAGFVLETVHDHVIEEKLMDQIAKLRKMLQENAIEAEHLRRRGIEVHCARERLKTAEGVLTSMLDAVGT